eukprot:g15734.t1
MSSQEQVIEGIDIDAALATLDDEVITSDQIKDLFGQLAEHAQASSARVAGLPSSQLSLAELESSKRRLQAKLEHLRTTGDKLENLKPADANG